MAVPGHGRSRSPLKEDEEDGDEEDPLEARIARSGCAGPHRALQECMAQWQDWRRCQPQLRAFGQCMAQRQRPREPPGPAPSPARPSPAPT
ncbi:cytochrome c oxidase assembly factor 4 homolog, mitochondrial [Pogoniulus pusillus]|uniref:cytochrome c oxidase assembly factor 4 homolog, mitochondrial n=1 Tax=Pogoniulus pusillus TaxID=488313 RepID=UPI0030B962F0